MGTSHSVSVVKVEDGTVYFRNPHGPNNLHPEQGLVDGSQSLYAMSVDEFVLLMHVGSSPLPGKMQGEAR